MKTLIRLLLRGAVRSGSALFAKACIFENLGSLRYIFIIDAKFVLISICSENKGAGQLHGGRAPLFLHM